MMYGCRWNGSDTRTTKPCGPRGRSWLRWMRTLVPTMMSASSWDAPCRLTQRWTIVLLRPSAIPRTRFLMRSFAWWQRLRGGGRRRSGREKRSVATQVMCVAMQRAKNRSVLRLRFRCRDKRCRQRFVGGGARHCGYRGQFVRLLARRTARLGRDHDGWHRAGAVYGNGNSARGAIKGA